MEKGRIVVLEETLDLVYEDLARALAASHHFKMVDDVELAMRRIRQITKGGNVAHPEHH